MRNSKKNNILDSFIVGGTNAGASLPGERLQAMLGTRIAMNITTRELHVPTPYGPIIAHKGDRIILYDDNTLGVELS